MPRANEEQWDKNLDEIALDKYRQDLKEYMDRMVLGSGILAPKAEYGLKELPKEEEMDVKQLHETVCMQDNLVQSRLTALLKRIELLEQQRELQDQSYRNLNDRFNDTVVMIRNVERNVVVSFKDVNAQLEKLRNYCGANDECYSVVRLFVSTNDH
jgi:hypothetical protein